MLQVLTGTTLRFFMKDYRLYDITDFAMDEDFIRWVQCKSGSDNKFWNHWLNQNPDKHLIIAEAKKILESLLMEEAKRQDAEITVEVNKLLKTIGETEPIEIVTQKTVFIQRKWWYAAAAAILITFFSGWHFFSPQKHTPTKLTYTPLALPQNLVEYSNTTDDTKLIELPDGSVIELAPDSRISYAKDFSTGNTRDVYMTGEAFFKVVKNPVRPFRVFANEIMTKVLGTSFVVRSFEKDANIKITVRTGKVSVYAHNGNTAKETAAPNKLGGIIVTCNQQLVYEKEKQKFQKILTENPLMVREQTQELVYDEEPLWNVFGQLNKDYGVWIIYDYETIKHCTVTADLRNESFYQKLDLICRAVGASYELVDGQVVIQSSGCK